KSSFFADDFGATLEEGATLASALALDATREEEEGGADAVLSGSTRVEPRIPVFMPKYTPANATAMAMGTSNKSRRTDGVRLERGATEGAPMGGGRIESGTGIPAAFAIDARTPLVVAPCASRAMVSSAMSASALGWRSAGSLARRRMTTSSSSFGTLASGH